MTSTRGALIRENAFVIAAIGLPVLVAAFFLVALAIPRWTVAPPGYDLVLRAARPYDATPSPLAVDFTVRDGQVEATVRRVPSGGYVQPWALLLFDHETMAIREIPLDLPAELREGEERRTIAVDSLSQRRVSSQAAAPDGYELQTRTRGGSGLLGDLFGMGRYRQRAALVNHGRIVQLNLPLPYQDPYQSPLYAVGWVVEG